MNETLALLLYSFNFNFPNRYEAALSSRYQFLKVTQNKILMILSECVGFSNESINQELIDIFVELTLKMRTSSR